MKTGMMTLAGLLVLAGAGALAGCVSTTAQAASAATPGNAVAAEAGQPGDADEIRCKRMVITGSRNGKKVCHTESEWAAMDRAADTLVQDMRTNPMPTGAGPGPGGESALLNPGFRGADSPFDTP